MDIYCAIDGTANNDPNKVAPVCYSPEALMGQSSSHVKLMNNINGFDTHKYYAGTADKVSGKSSGDIIDTAMDWVLSVYGNSFDKSKRLFLGGFSRGGASIIVMAHRLKAKGIPVQEMYLFDAVDRSLWMDNAQTNIIPKNVTMAFHALRKKGNGSRETFSNCGLESEIGNLEKKEFNTTHGGIGGWPNGAEMVKPGIGAEDAAYITAYGLARGTHKILNDPRQQFIHESMEPFPTWVSPEQERMGQKAALSWMAGKANSTISMSVGM